MPDSPLLSAIDTSKKPVKDDDDEAKTKEQLAREIAEIEAKLNPKKPKQKKLRKRDLKKIEKEIDSSHQKQLDDQNAAEQEEAVKLHERAKPKKKNQIAMTDAEASQIAQDLANKMQQAVEEDNANNLKKLPALKKYLLVEEVARQLRRTAISTVFLESGGCGLLGQWLEPLPDGTFPNLTVVQEILTTVDLLNIGPDELLLDKSLGRIVRLYAKNIPNMPQVVNLAKKIIDRWSRLVFGIKTNYSRDIDDDEEGDTNQGQYKRLRRKIEEMKTNAPVKESDSEQDEDPSSEKEVKTGPQRKQDQIVRSRIGIIMPVKNAFDFIEKPQSRDVHEHRFAMGQTKGHEKLRKIMTNLKKTNRPASFSSKMSIAKIFD